MSEVTPTPWRTVTGKWGKERANKWYVKQHEFPVEPFEGELEDEWGIYPPIGEAGPVALVAGEANARHIVHSVNCHDELLAACREAVEIINDLLNESHNVYPTPEYEAAIRKGVTAQLTAAIAKAEGK